METALPPGMDDQNADVRKKRKSAHTETRRHKEDQLQIQRPHLPKFPEGDERGEVRRYERPKGGETLDVRREMISVPNGVSCRCDYGRETGTVSVKTLW